MGVFDHLAGSSTVAKLASAPNGQVHGTLKLDQPFPPLWDIPGGNCRFGFKEVFNGYVVGPESTSFDIFQQAVRAGKLPMVPADSKLIPQDYFDAMYLAWEGTSLYDHFVTPYAIATGAGGTSAPAQPTAAQLAALQARVDTLNGQLNDVVEQAAGLSATNKTLASGRDATLKAVKAAEKLLPEVGKGGQWVRIAHDTFEKIKAAFATLVLLAVLVGLSGCAANRVVVTAAGGQVVGAAALVRCADLVTRNPGQAPVLAAQLNKAQQAVDAGSPLLGLFTVADGQLDPQARAALAVVGALLEQKMAAFLAAAQGAISGCRMGILSAAPAAPR